MRCLWLSWADTEPPHSGQLLYSGGLIEALGAAGAEVVVLALHRPGSRREDGAREGGVVWRLVGGRSPSAAVSLGSRLPNIARRCGTGEMRRALDGLLAQARWDAIIFDGLSAGWALAPVLQHRIGHRATKLVYVSHNHETSMRSEIAARHPEPAKRLVLSWDAHKIGRLERALVAAADLVTAITPEDLALYRAQWPQKPLLVLTPGYRGRSLDRREMTAALPRRAVIVGSFDWVAKQMNLEEFIRAADPIFTEQGIELQVVGKGEAGFIKRLARDLKATRFTGAVDAVERYLDGARIALVPERSGGGFKLKLLDYVFNRLPILALEGSCAGVPLKSEESILLYPDQAALARGVVRAIDGLDRLNRLQDTAYRVCRDGYDWPARGRRLLDAMAAA